MFWLVLRIRQWWISYLYGPTGLHPDFDWYFAHGYDQTIKLLPSIDHRPAPDAQHFVPQVRSFVVVIVTTMPYYVARLTTDPRHPWISGRQPHLSLLW